jgi:hypothetical protein
MCTLPYRFPPSSVINRPFGLLILDEVKLDMSSETFRLNTATIALFFEEGRQVARTVPQGAVVQVNTLEGDKLVEVEWEGRTILMFAQDIRSRGERVTGAA